MQLSGGDVSGATHEVFMIGQGVCEQDNSLLTAGLCGSFQGAELLELRLQAGIDRKLLSKPRM